MFSLENLVAQYQFNLQYAFRLTEDLSDEQAVTTPGKGNENHPVWTIGHLSTAAAIISKNLGTPYHLPEGYDELFKLKGPGDSRLPTKEIEKYPPLKAVLSEYSKVHQTVEQLILISSPDKFLEPFNWRFQEKLPTFGHMLQFMCLTHEAMHLGQLAAWRRAMGLKGKLAEV